MSIGSWLKSIFDTKEDKPTVTTIEPISILKTETPDKIIETKIRPVRVPTIMDIGERLALISHDLTHLRDEMISRSWFKSQYTGSSGEVIERLSMIESKLNILINTLNDFTKDINKTDLIKIGYPTISVSDRILKIIKEGKKIRYKDIRASMNVTDPTLCKYLKILLESKKIKKIKEGKAVYYIPF